MDKKIEIIVKELESKLDEEYHPNNSYKVYEKIE